VKITTQEENNDANLSIEQIQKMLHKFLTEKNMTKEELAQKIEISVEELEQLLCNKNTSLLIPKVNLPLVKLYCRTKWDYQLIKSKD
jgi:DNA-directed RNA polymerase specialized sigma subunit